MKIIPDDNFPYSKVQTLVILFTVLIDMINYRKAKTVRGEPSKIA